MKFVGAHVAVNNGVSSAPINAHNIGAKAFALFTRNPSRWQSKPISRKEAQAFKENCEEFGYTPDHILPHDSYLINLGSPEEDAGSWDFPCSITIRGRICARWRLKAVLTV